MPQGDPLTYFVDAERNLEAGATELARMGADEETVKAVVEMAQTCRDIIKALGRGQAQTGDQEPPAPRDLDEATSALASDMQAVPSDY